MRHLLFIVLLTFHTGLFAEIPRELKEQLGKDLQGNEDFKRAYVYYAEMADGLYDTANYENKDKFTEQFTKFAKSRLCMESLKTADTGLKIKPFAQQLDLIQRKLPGYNKVQELIKESSLIQATLLNTPKSDGHKFCNFKLGGDRKTISEKINEITKNNVTLKKAMNVILGDFSEYYTNSKLTDNQRSEITKKAVSGLICALYFTSEDQYEPVMNLISTFEDEMKTKPGFNKNIETLQIDMNASEQAKAMDGDPSLCAFKVDPGELAKHKTRKEQEKAATDVQYAQLQKILTKAHPKIKQMVEIYEKNFAQMIPNKEIARKMFIKNFPNYLDQMNQDVALNFSEMLKDTACQKKVAPLKVKCAVDEKFALVKDQKHLLFLMCSEEHKTELGKFCKFPALNAESRL